MRAFNMSNKSRVKQLTLLHEELREVGRRHPEQWEQIEQERAQIRAQIRQLNRSDFQDAELADLYARRQNYVPEKRIGFGWGLVITLGVVVVCVAFALKMLGAL